MMIMKKNNCIPENSSVQKTWESSNNIYGKGTNDQVSVVIILLYLQNSITLITSKTRNSNVLSQPSKQEQKIWQKISRFVPLMYNSSFPISKETKD